MSTYTDRWGSTKTEPASTPTPDWRPVAHVLLTDVQAGRYLLLAEGKDDAAAVKAVNRLVDSRKIKPCVVGGHRRYARDELDKFISTQTENWEGST